MKLKLWQVDTFASKPLEGNPAAVVPLSAWIDAGLMQKIARENNLAETAFFVKTGDGRYDLRWFTPETEVDLCGHATLASAWTLFEILEPDLSTVSFMTRSGELIVSRAQDGLAMSLPSDNPRPYEAPKGLAEEIGKALGLPPPKELHRGRYLLALWDDPKLIRGIRDCGEIDRVLKQHGGPRDLIVTAKGDEGYDFVSRFFAPDLGVREDPVTGSAHCILTPFWAKRLSKKTMKARQVSPRGGDLICTDEGARTVIAGRCALYLSGEIEV